MPGGWPLGPDMCNSNGYGLIAATTLGTALQSGAANTAGSWTQLTASSSSDVAGMFVFYQANNTQINFGVYVQIGIGGAGSEVVVIDYAAANSNAYVGNVAFFPVAIPSGTRISARALSANTNDNTLVAVSTLDASFTNTEGCSGFSTIGLSGTTGTQVTAGAANTKGSYTQLVASTARDYMGFILADAQKILAGQLADNAFIDVAIGAAASEVNILSNYFIAKDSGTSHFSPFIPINIPAGTRLSMRIQTTTGANSGYYTLLAGYQ